MTPLSLTDPLRSLLDGAQAEGRVRSQAHLGELRKPPVQQGVVGKTIASGDRIKLSTLASYAHAAGWTLHVEARFYLGPERDRARLYRAPVGDLDATVAQARILLAALGLEMSLVVEPTASKQ